MLQIESYHYRLVQLTQDNWNLPETSAGTAPSAGAGAAPSAEAGVGAGAVEPWPPTPELAAALYLLNKTISVHLDGPDKPATIATVVVSAWQLGVLWIDT